jgi:hypothetical protein
MEALNKKIDKLCMDLIEHNLNKYQREVMSSRGHQEETPKSLGKEFMSPKHFRQTISRPSDFQTLDILSIDKQSQKSEQVTKPLKKLEAPREEEDPPSNDISREEV